MDFEIVALTVTTTVTVDIACVAVGNKGRTESFASRDIVAIEELTGLVRGKRLPRTEITYSVLTPSVFAVPALYEAPET